MISFNAYSFSSLPNDALYKVLKLRSDVFVVEQQCIYPDLDGKDIVKGALHIIGQNTSNNDIVAYARCLPEGVSYKGVSIGRVVVAPSVRGLGIAKKLMKVAIEQCYKSWPGIDIEIGAQAHLQALYQSLGFAVTSKPYDEDGILHIDMKLGSENGL